MLEVVSWPLVIGFTKNFIPKEIVVSAYISAKFANKCEIKKLNRVVGTCLLVLGIATISLKLL